MKITINSIPSSLFYFTILFIIIQPSLTQKHKFACQITGCLFCEHQNNHTNICTQCDISLNFTSSPTASNSCSCLQKQILLLNKNECSLCSLILPNCQLCEYNSTIQKITCKKCLNDSFFDSVNGVDSTSCSKCSSNCLSCSNGDTCLKCQNGSFLQTRRYQRDYKIITDTICNRCYQPCLNCQHNNYNCTACNESYFLLESRNAGNNTCLKCMKNCLKCINDVFCEECQKQSLLYLNRCLKCQSFIANCSKCILNTTNNKIQCIECMGKFYVNTHLFLGPYLLFEAKCITKIQCQNKSTISTHFIQKADKCQSCNDAINHCMRCRSISSCDQCKKGFYSLNSWNCLPCTPLITNCIGFYETQTTQIPENQLNSKDNINYDSLFIVGITLSIIIILVLVAIAFEKRKQNALKFVGELQLDYTSQNSDTIQQKSKSQKRKDDEMQAQQLTSQLE